MDFYGTSGDDIIDQQKQKLGDNIKIFGGAGNDKITVFNGSVQGQAGNDTLISLGKFDVVQYWDSPTGIKILKSIEEISFSNGAVEQIVKVSDLKNRTDVKIANGKVINVSISGLRQYASSH